MHYHLEVIMPPTDDVKAALEEILHPFNENGDKDDEDRSGHPFWDWWQIGGRWSGQKLLHAFGEPRIQAFRELLADRHITVSGIQAGKPNLSPAHQVELVNRLWRDHFPESPVKECPLFADYTGHDGDTMPLGQVALDFSCHHVIIAGAGYQEGTLTAQEMVIEKIWNGVSYQPTTWDGTLGAALDFASAKMVNYKEEYRASRTPQPDWLVVTVDYHS